MQYIYRESNHPSNIIKHIPTFIKNRISNLSSTEILFKESLKHNEDNACVNLDTIRK